MWCQVVWTLSLNIICPIHMLNKSTVSTENWDYRFDDCQAKVQSLVLIMTSFLDFIWNLTKRWYKTQGFRVKLQVSGGRGNRLRTRQGQGKDEIGTRQGQDWEVLCLFTSDRTVYIMKELYRKIKINKHGPRFLPKLSLSGLAEVVYFYLLI